MNDWSITVTAFATVVNAVAVVVLVVVTIWYARSAKRQANASEQQAKAASEQAKAAQSQAGAAQAQASTASATLYELRRQLYDQKDMEVALVEGEIKSALTNTEYLLAPGPRSNLESAIRANALPQEVVLAPSNPEAVLECARRVSTALALQLGHVFDELRIAKSEIDGVRSATANWYKPDDVSNEAKKVTGSIWHLPHSI